MATTEIVQTDAQKDSVPAATDQQTEQSVTTEENTSLKDILKSKFTSRKFILALVGVITGILGIIGCSDNTIAIVAFTALEVLSIVGYIIMEGHIDAAAVKDVTDLIDIIADMIETTKNGGTVTIPENKPSDSILDTLPANVEIEQTSTDEAK